MAEARRPALMVDDDNPEAVAAAEELRDRYRFVDFDEAEVAVVVGGDGSMLRALHRVLSQDRDLPLYGLNRGTVGFLMNHYDVEGLDARVSDAEPTVLTPLQMTATDGDGRQHRELAINEVALFRASAQSAAIGIRLDGRPAIERLVGDGVMVATSAGSTAYNRSAGGPIIPLAAPLLALTPMAGFEPRGWPGALLADDTQVRLEVLDPGRRPVTATADTREVRDVREVEVVARGDLSLTVLFDPGHGLEARILREQFRT